MKKNLFTQYILLLFVITSLFLFFSTVHAESLADQISGQIQAGAQAADIGAAVPPQIIIAEMIKIVLTLTGTIFLVLVVFGGYLIMTDRGEGERVEKGKKSIRAAVIGLIITLMSYSITLFVGNALMSNVYGDEYRNKNIRVKCSVVRVILGKGCDSIEHFQ